MKIDKKIDILNKFKSKGFELDENLEKDFYVDFRAFINDLINDEILLLEELYRICEKQKKGEELTFIEKNFHDFLINKQKNQ